MIRSTALVKYLNSGRLSTKINVANYDTVLSFVTETLPPTLSTTNSGFVLFNATSEEDVEFYRIRINDYLYITTLKRLDYKDLLPNTVYTISVEAVNGTTTISKTISHTFVLLDATSSIKFDPLPPTISNLTSFTTRMFNGTSLQLTNPRYTFNGITTNTLFNTDIELFFNNDDVITTYSLVGEADFTINDTVYVLSTTVNWSVDSIHPNIFSTNARSVYGIEDINITINSISTVDNNSPLCVFATLLDDEYEVGGNTTDDVYSTYTTVYSDSFNISYPIYTLPDRLYKLYVKAKDQVGNESEISMVFEVNAEPKMVSFLVSESAKITIANVDDLYAINDIATIITENPDIPDINNSNWTSTIPETYSLNIKI